jgi:hypothetical protein
VINSSQNFLLQFLWAIGLHHNYFLMSSLLIRFIIIFHTTFLKIFLSEMNPVREVWRQEWHCTRHVSRQPLHKTLSVAVTIPGMCELWERWTLREPSDCKIWSWAPWDSEPSINVLARASGNLAVSGLRRGATNVAPTQKDRPLTSWKRRPHI